MTLKKCVRLPKWSSWLLHARHTGARAHGSGSRELISGFCGSSAAVSKIFVPSQVKTYAKLIYDLEKGVRPPKWSSWLLHARHTGALNHVRVLPWGVRVRVNSTILVEVHVFSTSNINVACVFTYQDTNVAETAALQLQNPQIIFRDTEPCACAPVWRACTSQLDHFGGSTLLLNVKNELCVCFYLLGPDCCRNSGTRAAKTSVHRSGPRIPKFWQIVGTYFLPTGIYILN